MTVGELIVELQKLPPDCVVVRDEVTQGYAGVVEVHGPVVRLAVPYGMYYSLRSFLFVDTMDGEQRSHLRKVQPVIVIS